MNKANRDAAWNKMTASEKLKHRKTSIRNQQIHPEYVCDYEKETGRILTAQDKGFGNGMYRTYFKALYSIEEVRNYF